MGMQDYRLILETACTSSSTWNADSIFYGNPVVLNGLHVWFQYFEPADLCRIVIDLGPIEDKARGPVWRMMLESNCRNNSEFLPLLALHPENGNAILVMHLSLEKFEFHARRPDFFRHLEGMLVPLVESWRDGNDVMSRVGQSASPIFGDGFA